MVIDQVEYYSQVRARRVEWLWYPYVPYGKLTVIQGDPGEGKSTLILNIAALLSTGKPMPDGSLVESPQTIIGNWTDPDEMFWGFPGMLTHDGDVLYNRLACIEKNFDSLDDLQDDYENYLKNPDVDFERFCDDIFGDG